MKRLLCALLVGVTGMAYGQSVRGGAPVTLYSGTISSSAYSTTSWSAESYVDLQSYDSVGIAVINGYSTPASIYMKYQWSPDASTWYDAYVLSTGTASTTEQPYTALKRRIDMTVNTSSGTVYSERETRKMRYFRPAVESSSTTTTTVTIKVQPMNNQN